MDEFLKDLPKFVRLSDDMHDMANYINDMRILTFVIAGTAYIGIFILLILKFYQHRQKKCKRSVAEDSEEQEGTNMVEQSNGYHQNRPEIDGLILKA